MGSLAVAHRVVEPGHIRYREVTGEQESLSRRLYTRALHQPQGVVMQTNPSHEQSPPQEVSGGEDSISVSRRTALKRAGWIVPALAVLPLSQAFGTGYTHISPGPDTTDESTLSSTSGSTSRSGGGFFSFLRSLLFWWR
jgi:hypothetical protein